jgi:hypothetical protein
VRDNDLGYEIPRGLDKQAILIESLEVIVKVLAEADPAQKAKVSPNWASESRTTLAHESCLRRLDPLAPQYVSEGRYLP